MKSFVFLLAITLLLATALSIASPVQAVCQPTGSNAAISMTPAPSPCPSTPDLSCTDPDNECPCDLTYLNSPDQTAAKDSCRACMENNPKNVWTAIGCLSAGNPVTGQVAGGPSFIGQVLGWGVITGVGVAFLLIVFAGFTMATSAGDPKRFGSATELLWSAISGLLLILFSLFLLNLIGVKILNLPGFLVPQP